MFKNNHTCTALAIFIVTVNALTCNATLGGRLIAWGENGNGLLDVPEGEDYVAVSASWKHALALRSDGSIVGWGQNNWGQSDPPPGHDFIDISAGQIHSLALRSDGSLVAWGYNGDGQRNVPDGHDFTAIAAGYDHSLGLRSDGSILAWGNNEEGEGNVTSIKNAMAIAAGDNYSVVVTSLGQLRTLGQCSRFFACSAPNGDNFSSVVVDGASGGSHGLALRLDGTLAAWGIGDYAQPVDGSDFMAIAVGNKHSLAMREDNTLIAWGDNTYGQCDVPQTSGRFIAIAGAIQASVAIVDFSHLENGLPVADAGEDVIAHANEEIVLDASGSYDPDGVIVTYTWKRLPDDVTLYSGPDPKHITRALGRAEEIIELTVTDNSEGTSSQTITIINALVNQSKI